MANFRRKKPTINYGQASIVVFDTSEGAKRDTSSSKTLPAVADVIARTYTLPT